MDIWNCLSDGGKRQVHFIGTTLDGSRAVEWTLRRDKYGFLAFFGTNVYQLRWESGAPQYKSFSLKGFNCADKFQVMVMDFRLDLDNNILALVSFGAGGDYMKCFARGVQALNLRISDV